MGRIINLMNNHNRPQPSQEDTSMLGDLDTSLLARWKDVLHEIGDRDGKQTIEDQHLTAVLGMAIGHTRRLHARFTSGALGTDLNQKILSHATWLDPVNKMGPHTLATSNRHGNTITVKIVKHSEDEEGEPEETATQQEPSGGTADQSNDNETSEEEDRLEELELPKFDPGTINVEPDKQVNKKGGRGTIPRAVKKPIPKPSSAPTSNHSTPKKARKGPRTQTHNSNPNTLQDNLLKEFVDEAKDLSKKVDWTITEW